MATATPMSLTATRMRSPWPWLYPALADFILRTNGRWAATAKWIPRALAAFDPALAATFDAAFADLFERRDTGPLIGFAEQSLAPFGGRLFNGYRADAKAQERIPFPAIPVADMTAVR
jgi:hypothetical protein